MNTELAIPEPEPTALEIWARSAHQAGLVAVSLSKTSFVPDTMRGRPEEVTACILVGQELGLSPMSALRSVNLIHGTPAIAAMTMRALVVNAGHEVWLESSTATRAVVKGRRKDSTHVQESVWTTDRAKQLGVLGKSNWKSQPTAMLVARATAEVCRLIAPDALLGLSYAAEELEDDGTVTETPAEPEKPKQRRTAKRAPLPEQRKPPEIEAAPEPDPEPEPQPEPAAGEPEPDPEPEPEPDGPARVRFTPGGEQRQRAALQQPDPDPEPDPEPVPPDDPPSDAQRKMMFALYKQIGITDREDLLAHARVCTMRPLLTSSAELTKADVSKIIDSLQTAEADLPPEEKQ